LADVLNYGRKEIFFVIETVIRRKMLRKKRLTMKVINVRYRYQKTFCIRPKTSRIVSLCGQCFSL